MQLFCPVEHFGVHLPDTQPSPLLHTAGPEVQHDWLFPPQAGVPHTPHQRTYGRAPCTMHMQFPVVTPCWQAGKQVWELGSQ